MKIIQLNTWFGKLGYRLVDFLNEQAADFVCMQEVSDLPGHAGPLLHTLDEIKTRAGFKYASIAPVFSHPFMRRTYQFGNTVMGQRPFESSEVIFTRGQFTENFDILSDDMNIRNFQHVTVNVAGNILNILNLQGHFVENSKMGNAETMRQMKILARYIDKLNGPIILCGDFNLVPNSPSIEQINQRLDNLPLKYGIDNTYSSLHDYHFVCDYIFVSKDIKVKRFEVSNKLVSDHKPLIMEFDL